jgi:hypothetical protein
LCKSGSGNLWSFTIYTENEAISKGTPKTAAKALKLSVPYYTKAIPCGCTIIVILKV